MKYSSYLNNDFLARNYTVQDVLKNYDNDNGISDGKYSKAELRAFISDAASSIAKLLVGKRLLVNTVFGLLDNNKVGKKDGYITEAEINWYLAKYAESNLDELRPKTILEACDFLDAKEAEVKRKKTMMLIGRFW